jgi:hypothetical protein
LAWEVLCGSLVSPDVDKSVLSNRVGENIRIIREMRLLCRELAMNGGSRPDVEIEAPDAPYLDKKTGLLWTKRDGVWIAEKEEH